MPLDFLMFIHLACFLHCTTHGVIRAIHMHSVDFQSVWRISQVITLRYRRGSLRKLVFSGELKREGSGKSTCYYRIK